MGKSTFFLDEPPTHVLAYDPLTDSYYQVDNKISLQNGLKYTPNPLMYPHKTYSSYVDLEAHCPDIFNEKILKKLERKYGPQKPYTVEFVPRKWYVPNTLNHN
jgi:hypothetical protein